ncbi:MAG: hypothetical protein H7258_15535 [Ferruginibacter sp.]|nr:hypothetical protein [Ferruginibacter sp.]
MEADHNLLILLISACLSVNGVFGTTNTSNASGGLTELVFTTSCNVLPVSLLTFTGTRVDAIAKLRWTTASEINFKIRCRAFKEWTSV